VRELAGITISAISLSKEFALLLSGPHIHHRELFVSQNSHELCTSEFVRSVLQLYNMSCYKCGKDCGTDPTVNVSEKKMHVGCFVCGKCKGVYSILILCVNQF
jgi:hypothetical protein